ncbi:peptide-methionine (R)-S-oxide reductase [Lutibacter agarilyticus]|uniref:peptide-methionine (R)-S-oxide reductase n=2 Tax=Lutibacter agarilyticus TaxID=1109740 RepID=A0A238YZ48_9FLAO|nr:peptide-methionine (R)-S-oxide reductase MsrB [Lutibacter agarilyticus]SNR76340.1 peptide-methionine (R)-S-oxide reductase [Lutibacter agarilyticus]
MKHLFLIVFLSIFSVSTNYSQQNSEKKMVKKVIKTDEEWKAALTPEQYYILRQKGTDRPSEAGYTSHFEKGTYHCAACDLQLFESNSKFESHCGWPSFDDAIDGTVEYVLDKTHGMVRTEIICAACDGHLGHIFNDGPKETTGERYCVNTTSIKFVKAEK